MKIAKEQIGNCNEEKPEPYKELCPKCKKEMVVIEVITKNDMHIFWKYGNEQGPPRHRDIIAAA